MKFLIDENLPRALVTFLNDQNHEAAHVSEVGLAGRADEEIARAARLDERVIVTRDRDFDALSAALGCQVVLVAIGNCSNAELVARVNARLQSSLDSLSRGETLVLID